MYTPLDIFFYVPRYIRECHPIILKMGRLRLSRGREFSKTQGSSVKVGFECQVIDSVVSVSFSLSSGGS